VCRSSERSASEHATRPRHVRGQRRARPPQRRRVRITGCPMTGPARDLVGYGRHAPRVVWPDGAKVALSFIVAYEEGSEYSVGDGDDRNEGLTEISYAMDPAYRDLAAESVYEY